jgi:hypothetical protein
MQSGKPVLKLRVFVKEICDEALDFHSGKSLWLRIIFRITFLITVFSLRVVLLFLKCTHFLLRIHNFAFYQHTAKAIEVEILF